MSSCSKHPLLHNTLRYCYLHKIHH